ncbi:MAG: hypothetical protein ABF649_21350, partial [Bacillus sp. (in: firmicutes)]
MGIIKNIVTFGASGRIEKKVEEFEELQNEYKSLYASMESKREEVNRLLEETVHLKVQALKSLKKISKISKYLKGKDRDFIYRSIGNDYETIDFNKIDDTITAGQVAISATKGLSAGVGTAVGAWALVSTIGTASTGTAIAGLSGVAATNATLAWFGGGSLAVGGGGIAAGTAVLGGIVAIPVLALTGVFSHVSANKKIHEIEQQMIKVLEAVDQLNANILKLDLIEERSKELSVSIKKAQEVFEREYKKVYKEIYKYPLFSKMFKWTKKNIFRRNYFSKKDYDSIAYIG